jgi:hypothetical protein
MKMVTLRTMFMGLVIAVAAISLTGCGIPVKLSESVDLVKDIEVPAMPQSVDDIEDIPEEFQQYVDSVEWETEAQALLEELQNEEFSFQQEEEFCDLPDLQKIRDEAAAKLPPFLAKRIEVREVIVESIRFVADAGDFGSILELTNVLTVDGGQYTFSISGDEGASPVLTLTPNPPLDLADVIHNPDFDGCITNNLSITGTLPETEILFKAVLDLDITLYLRIL